MSRSGYHRPIDPGPVAAAALRALRSDPDLVAGVPGGVRDSLDLDDPRPHLTCVATPRRLRFLALHDDEATAGRIALLVAEVATARGGRWRWDGGATVACGGRFLGSACLVPADGGVTCDDAT
jgi:hypothetical protein